LLICLYYLITSFSLLNNIISPLSEHRELSGIRPLSANDDLLIEGVSLRQIWAISLLDQFTRSRQLQRRQQFTRQDYSIQTATEEAADRSTRPSYSILYSNPLLHHWRPTLQDLLIYQSVFGSSSFPTQPDIWAYG